MERLILVLYILPLTLLLLYGLYGLVMVAHYLRLRPRDPSALPLEELAAVPMVTVQLPIYNELHVASRLIDAVCALDYPRGRLEIQVLDDSTDATAELVARAVAGARARGFAIEQIRRGDRTGFKAGALREGLRRASGEFIAIFDADFLPTPDFLRRIVPHLAADPGLGMVQARWEHLNQGYSLLTRMQALALDAHFAMEQQVRNRRHLFINFNGTAGVWRRDCIVDAGDWQADTLTEDLDLSYRAQLRGWRFLYLNELAVPAELPAEINGLKAQQFRWTKGAIETARKHLAPLWRSRQPLRIKLHATLHLGSNVVFPCILLVALLNVPVVFIKSQRPDLAGFFEFLSCYTISSISSFLFYLLAQRDLRGDWRRRMLFYPVLMAGTMGLAVNNSRAAIEALIGHRSAFHRTPKYAIRGKDDHWRSSGYAERRIGLGTIAELALALYFLFGVLASIRLLELAAIPFQLLFLFGFGFVGVLSLRQAWGGRGKGLFRRKPPAIATGRPVPAFSPGPLISAERQQA